MLGWVQRVLPQPPGTPQKTEQAAGPQPETESKPEAKPLPEPEPQPEQEPEPEPAPEEAVPEVQALPPQEPMEGEGEVEAGPSLQETQEVDPPQSTSQPQAAVAKVNRPSSWMLSWFWKGMEKVVPQPVCNSSGGQNLTAGEGGPDQGGAQIPEPCGTGNPGSADGSDKASRTQDTEHSLWLLRWLEQNLEKVLPQPPRPSQAWKVEPESAVLDPDPPGTPMEPEPTENPSQPNPGPLEPEEEPPAEPQPGFQASSLPPPGDPVRLIEWLLHRLEMALPQPVLHGKAAEQELDCPGTCDVQTRATAAGGL
ncbi:cyclic nucleotide-gated cation channel beta-1 isoform X2 [Grammomys surdaster]|uniref:cyclic nucleotide-gated cation channel beta-1 isoform X2 n=1 Tax=Grammomys surdaster TaxID=491861 RepID=UPI0010A01947|nr:cyclic nucleotide-gated cation channel beta-1 isoform X2 [Grammomys surdaster]